MVARGLIIMAAILWSTGGAAIKLADLDAAQIAGGRTLVSALLLGLLLPSARGPYPPRVMLAGAFYAATNILFVFANTRTTAGATIFLQNIAPVWVLILSPLVLRERPSRLEVLSVPISLAGSALFFFGDLSGGRIEGNLAALGASVSYALLIISYRRLPGGEGLSATVAGCAIVVLLCAPLAWSGPLPTLAGVASVVYLGAIQQALGAVLFIRGIRGVSALEGALLILLEPLLAPLWAFLAVGESMTRWAVLGGGLILGSTLARTLAAVRRPT